ncbi:MAG TPA: hypothetical protein PLX97_10325, partial [Gemmatales bacterium]|nr:hypothetical protein [Gemmatales bacterium]
QRWFLLAAILIPAVMIGLMGLQVLSWKKKDDDFPLMLFLAGMLALFTVPTLIWSWFSQRYYLKVASAEPMPDELFVAGCSNVAGTPVLAELALEIRNIIEDKLMFPHGTLRPDTNLGKFGMWAHWLYAPALAEKFKLSASEFQEPASNVRILANFIHLVESAMRGRQYVREEPGEEASQTPSQVLTEPGDSGIAAPLVLRETSKLFRRWVFNNLIVIPFCLFLGYLCSRGGVVGTVIAVVFFGFFIFATLILGSLFPTSTIDPRTRRVSVVWEVFGWFAVWKKERPFEEFEMVRVYDYRSGSESKQAILAVGLICVGSDDDWMLGDNARQMGPYCDAETARQISKLMGLPLEIVQHAPPPPRWLRRFLGVGKSTESDGAKS